MSQKQTFLEFITNGQYQSQTVIDGLVQNAPTYTPIDDSPIGWEKNEVQWIRKVGYWGVIKSFVTNLTFVEEAAQIIRYFLYGTGVDTVLYYIIVKLDQAFGAGMIHKSWYKGQFALETARDGDLGVEVNLTEGGFFKDFEARKATPYEYPLHDDDDVCTLENNGMEIDQNTSFVVSDGTLTNDYGNHSIDLNKISTEAINEVGTQSVDRVVFTNNDELRTNCKPFLTTGATPTVVEFEWDYNVYPILRNGITPNPLAGGAMLIRWFDKGGDNIAEGSDLLADWGGSLTSDYDFYERNHHVVGAKTLTIPANQEVYLIQSLKIGNALQSDQDDVSFTYSNNPNDFFRIHYNYRFPTTILDAIRLIDLGEKLCRSASEGVSGLVSDLLSQDQNTLVTCGDSVRGLNGSIKTSMQEYLKAVDAIKCMSFGIEDNNARIELREYAFQRTAEITDLGEANIPDTEYLTYATDLMYNLILMGYRPKEIGAVNGRFSFNNTSTWKTPLKSVQNTYDQVCPYYSDPFLIELYRINLDKKTTTDDSNDNDVFLIDCDKVYQDVPTQNITFFAFQNPDMGQMNINGVVGLGLVPGIRFKVTQGFNAGSYVIANVFENSGNTIVYVNGVNWVIGNQTTGVEFRHYRLRRIAYDLISGVNHPDSVYNIELSPARNFRKHWAWIHSSLDEFESGTVTFQTTDKNRDLVTRLGQVVIAESADIPVSTMAPKYFKPKYMSFEVESPFNLNELMDANPLGHFLYQESGVNRRGYPMSISTVPETLETQTYKLLSTADNNFSNRK